MVGRPSLQLVSPTAGSSEIKECNLIPERIGRKSDRKSSRLTRR
jgi:hypothetical protein